MKLFSVNGNCTINIYIESINEESSINSSAYEFKWNSETAVDWVEDFDLNYTNVKMKAALMENNIEVRENGKMFLFEVFEYLWGIESLHKVLDGRDIDLNSGWIYDPNRPRNINIDCVKDPEDSYSLIITLIPDGDITKN